MKNIAIFLIFIIAGHAQVASSFYCQLDKDEALKLRKNKKIHVPDIPTFFFRTDPEGNYLGYSTFRNDFSQQGNTNKVYDIEKNQLIPVPGHYDPVLMHSDRLMVTPATTSLGLKFYDLEKIKKDLNTAPIYHDKSMKGYYQSVGILRESEEFTDYRVIIEFDRIFYRDYRELKQNGRLKGFFPLGKRKILCADQDDFKLPMLSKDGQLVSGMDVTTGKTVVYKINKFGECELDVSFPFLTGKASFSWDNRYLVYHKYVRANGLESYSTNGEVGSYLDIPLADRTSNIFVYDRLDDVHFQVTYNQNVNSIFPDFLRDGRIIFVNHPHDMDISRSFEVMQNDWFRKNYSCSLNY